jgi:hypothetical protein
MTSILSKRGRGIDCLSAKEEHNFQTGKIRKQRTTQLMMHSISKIPQKISNKVDDIPRVLKGAY